MIQCIDVSVCDILLNNSEPILYTSSRLSDSKSRAWQCTSITPSAIDTDSRRTQVSTCQIPTTSCINPGYYTGQICLAKANSSNCSLRMWAVTWLMAFVFARNNWTQHAKDRYQTLFQHLVDVLSWFTPSKKRDIDSIMVQCWAGVVDDGRTSIKPALGRCLVFAGLVLLCIVRQIWPCSVYVSQSKGKLRECCLNVEPAYATLTQH